MKRFYFAHSVGLMKRARSWQLTIEGKYDVKFINPFYNNPNERAEDLLDAIKSKRALHEYLNRLTMEQCSGIMEHDLELIRKSDGVVAYFDKITMGTAMEIFYAAYLLRIPVYAISKKYTNHPWLRILATKCFRTRTEFKHYLESQGYRKRI